MHPNAKLARPGSGFDSFEFLPARVDTVPGINTLDANLAAFLQESAGPLRNIEYIISTGAASGTGSGCLQARPALERNEEVGGGQKLLDLEIPIERQPKVFQPTQINQGE